MNAQQSKGAQAMEATQDRIATLMVSEGVEPEKAKKMSGMVMAVVMLDMLMASLQHKAEQPDTNPEVSAKMPTGEGIH
jgi:hypothetical protein